ncbi:MAG: FAD-dependent oxidoreductase, partial [Dehalococcoidia bacterium]
MSSHTLSIESLPVAVIGAGPVGLAAAAQLAARKMPFLLLEAGPAVGHSISSWAHVQLFSPWRYCVDAEARTLLEETDWTAPDPDALPTGGDLVTRYLTPLAAHPAIAPHLRTDAPVASISRALIDKVRSEGREAFPFEVQLKDGSRVYARAVIDATGTWTNANPMGTNGRPARGERDHQEHIAYGIPDVLGSARERYAEKRVLVVGSGHSAINSVLNLLDLQVQAPETSIIWALRRRQIDSVYGGEENDALPARGALGQRARGAVESGALDVLAPFRIERVGHLDDGRLEVTGQLDTGTHSVVVDQVIVATGFRPDLDMLRELRLGLDPALESTQALGPLIDPNLHSCGTVPPHGYRELSHPEPNFYVIGSKSYGRAPTFLMATGFEQARSVIAFLDGDLEAAAKVELVLPETGVCGAPSDDGTSCCTPAAAPVRSWSNLELIPMASADACCGGPAADGVDACCVADAEAKALGETGCGC